MRIEEKHFSSLEDFLMSTTMPGGELYGSLNGFIYRGESTSAYKLIPSVLRQKPNQESSEATDYEFIQIENEYMALKRFYKLANYNGLNVPYIEEFSNSYMEDFPVEHVLMTNEYKWMPTDIAELAVLAQHYGLKTRMLDWTFDLFVAMYFASLGAIKRKSTEGQNKKNDTMVIWALNMRHIQAMQMLTREIPLKFIIPKYANNPNLEAQKGILTYWQTSMKGTFSEMKQMVNGKNIVYVDRTPLDEQINKFIHMDDGGWLYKFHIPVNECVKMYSHISKMGYRASRLFPGYHGVIREMEEEALRFAVATKQSNRKNE